MLLALAFKEQALEFFCIFLPETFQTALNRLIESGSRDKILDFGCSSPSCLTYLLSNGGNLLGDLCRDVPCLLLDIMGCLCGSFPDTCSLL